MTEKTIAAIRASLKMPRIPMDDEIDKVADQLVELGASRTLATNLANVHAAVNASLRQGRLIPPRWGA